MVDSEVKNVFPVIKVQKIPVKTGSRMHHNLGFPPSMTVSSQIDVHVRFVIDSL